MLGTSLFRAISHSCPAIVASNISRFATDAIALGLPKRAAERQVSDPRESRSLHSPRVSTGTQERSLSGIACRSLPTQCNGASYGGFKLGPRQTPDRTPAWEEEPRQGAAGEEFSATLDRSDGTNIGPGDGWAEPGGPAVPPPSPEGPSVGTAGASSWGNSAYGDDTDRMGQLQMSFATEQIPSGVAASLPPPMLQPAPQETDSSIPNPAEEEAQDEMEEPSMSRYRSRFQPLQADTPLLKEHLYHLMDIADAYGNAHWEMNRAYSSIANLLAMSIITCTSVGSAGGFATMGTADDPLILLSPVVGCMATILTGFQTYSKPGAAAAKHSLAAKRWQRLERNIRDTICFSPPEEYTKAIRTFQDQMNVFQEQSPAVDIEPEKADRRRIKRSQAFFLALSAPPE